MSWDCSLSRHVTKLTMPFQTSDTDSEIIIQISSQIRLHPLPLHGHCYPRLASSDPSMFRVGHSIGHSPDNSSQQQRQQRGSNSRRVRPEARTQMATDFCFTRHTEPGGWVECIDLDLEWNSPDGSLTPSHASKFFNTAFLKAARKGGMEPCPGPLLERWLHDAGFNNVTAERHVWSVGPWPANKHLVNIQIVSKSGY